MFSETNLVHKIFCSKYRYKLKANLIQNFAQDTDAWKTISSLLDMVAIFSFYGGTANGIDT